MRKLRVRDIKQFTSSNKDISKEKSVLDPGLSDNKAHLFPLLYHLYSMNKNIYFLFE